MATDVPPRPKIHFGRIFSGVVTLVLLASFLDPGQSASAALPAGATAKPPTQALFGGGTSPDGGTSKAGGKSAPPSSTPKPVPGAVGPEKKHPDPMLPQPAVAAAQ